MATIVNEITQALMSEMKMLWRNGGTKGLYPYDKVTPENKRKKAHALDSSFQKQFIIALTPEMNYFEIGNPVAEKDTPHYHILEDAEIIRNPSTKKSRGSQAKVKDKAKRDYSVLGYEKTTKTFVQEYRQKGVPKPQGGFRENIYYNYIENLVIEAGGNIASRFNAKFVTSTDDTIAVGDLNPNFRGS